MRKYRLIIKHLEIKITQVKELIGTFLLRFKLVLERLPNLHRRWIIGVKIVEPIEEGVQDVATTQQLILGNTVFTVSIGSYTPPGPPDSTNLGSIGAHTIVRVSHITPVEFLPEPGTMTLSLLGLAAFGVGRRWLPRRGRRANP